MQNRPDKQSDNSRVMFQRLVSVRNRWRFSLAFLTLLAHAFFIGGVTVYRDLFSTPVSQGATLTLGIAFTALVIVLFIVLELVYIVVTSKTLDPMQASVRKEFDLDV